LKGKILLVDDNEAFLDSTKDVLEDEGYEIFTAKNGEDAIRMVGERPFEVILMDIKMPGLSGVETFIEIKKINPVVKVIMVTAYSVESLIRKALKEGAYAVLKKPLNMSMLLKEIDIIIKSKNGGSILLADDDKAFCDNLESILNEENYKVIPAYDGEEAVKTAGAYPFDILLIDMKLPILNGLEVYRRIKKIKPNTVAIIITGYAEEMDMLIKQMLRENAYTYLAKPLDMKKLLGLLKHIDNAKRNDTYKKPLGDQL
jgi:two-component system, NtrC family, response regulator HydG